MTLSQLSLLDRYRSDYDRILNDFYMPCLSEATDYIRGVGFFSIAALGLALAGVSQFLRNNGRMKLIVSPALSQADVDAIISGYRKREEVIDEALTRSFDGFSAESSPIELQLISWMIANQRLDIKVAVMVRGRSISAYHEKVGIFRDNGSNTVAFTGSANETVNGMVGNFERIDVFRSWLPNDSARVEATVRDCETLWNNETPGLLVYDFPEAVKRDILRRIPTTSMPEILRDQRSGTYNLTRMELRPKQVAAVEAWQQAGRRGLIEMATGTGKTITALACATMTEPLRFLVVAVPSLELGLQWVSSLKRLTDFPTPLEAFGDSSRWMEKLFRKLLAVNDPEASLAIPIVIGTYSSLSTMKTNNLINDAGGIPANSLLICDEAHNAGAETYSRVLRDDYHYRLGLSATPVRKYDEVGTDLVLDYFGGTVFAYGIGEAIKAGELSPYEYVVEPSYLDAEEFEQYSELTKQIGALMSSGNAVDEELGRRLLLKRAAILKSARSKVKILERIANANDLKKTLIYVANIAEATAVAEMLSRSGIKSARYSSVDPDRRRILVEFEKGRLDVLVSINCLDEGVDVPEAQLAIIAASDSSERQFIQRRGRVLRVAPRKARATIIDFLVLPPENIGGPPFRQEISRISEFARYAQNSQQAISVIGRLLAPYGLSYYNVLEEMGQ